MKLPLLLLLATLVSAAAAAEEAPRPATQGAASSSAEPAHPAAGFGNEAFFVRSDDDNFILLLSGRLQVDFLGYQGGQNEPDATFLDKRARIELFGTYLKHFDFQIAADSTFASGPTVTDSWINANFTPLANFQAGQFNAPFTMDNRQSDKFSDFQERSSAVRAFGIPENKMTGAMVWGQPGPAERDRWAYWSVGLFNGEGSDTFPHKSNHFDTLGRAWFAPLGLAGNHALRNVWVGASYWNGFHAPPLADQPDRFAMKDPGGFTFFKPVAGAVHTGNFGQVTKWGLELNAPVGPFVLKAEYVHGDERLREVSGGKEVRRATLSGGAWYARLSYFVFGDPLINGLGGMQNPPSRLYGELRPGRIDPALQLVLGYDHVGSTYAADDGATGAADRFAGDYGIDTFAVGANYWYTKHVRMTGNLLFNTFGGADARPRASGDTSYEVTLRLAVAL